MLVERNSVASPVYTAMVFVDRLAVRCVHGTHDER